jgi:hypothetical protein
MIGEVLLLLAVVIGAGGVGLWLGIVLVAPRLQRRIDRASASEPDRSAKEPDGPAD